MVNVIGKRCDHADGCSKQPHFGQPGSPANRCASHKDPDMVYLNMKRCDDPDGCSKQASFGLPGGLRSRCATHKDTDMVYLARGSRATRSSSGGLGTPREPGHGPVPLLDGGNMPGARKKPRQAATVPASLPIRQPAAGTTGSGRSCKRSRGMVQALLPQATQAEMAGPSAEAPPPPSAITTVNPRRRLSRLAAASTTMAGPNCSGGQGIPVPTAPSAAPPAPPRAKAGASGAEPHVTTGRANPLQLRDVHRRRGAKKTRAPVVPFPPVIRAAGSSGAPPSGEESAPLAGAAAGTRSGAARGTGIRVMRPAVAPAAAKGIHSGRGAAAAKGIHSGRGAAAAKGIHSGRGAKAAQAPHRLFEDGQNKRYAVIRS